MSDCNLLYGDQLDRTVSWKAGKDVKNYDAIPIRPDVFESLPENVKPLYRHWVAS